MALGRVPFLGIVLACSLFFICAASFPSADATNSGAVTWKLAPTCCKGCYYSSDCCCAPGRKPITIKKTRTQFITVTGKAKVPRSIPITESEVDETENQDSPIVDHGLFARHLCPVCPKGAKVAGKTSSGDNFKYCCAARKTVTKVIRKTITRTKAALPTLKGKLFHDIDGNNAWTPGVDKPIGNTLVVLIDDPTAGKKSLAVREAPVPYSQTTTAANGDFVFVLKKVLAHDAPLAITRASDTSIVLAKAQADGTGMFGPTSFVPIPVDIPWPVIKRIAPAEQSDSSSAITYATAITVFGTAFAGSTVDVYEDDTLLGSALAAADGSWNLQVTFAAPDQPSVDHVLQATATLGTVVSSKSDPFTVTIREPGVVIATTKKGVPVTTASGVHHTTHKNVPVTTKKVTAAAETTTAGGSNPLATTQPAPASTTQPAGTTTKTATMTPPPAPLIVGFYNDTSIDGSVGGNTGLNYSADHRINGDAVDLYGTAAANSVVKLYKNGTFIGQTTAAPDGSWTYLATSLTVGVHGFTASATLLGLESSKTAELEISVERNLSGASNPRISYSIGPTVEGSNVTVVCNVPYNSANMECPVPTICDKNLTAGIYDLNGTQLIAVGSPVSVISSGDITLSIPLSYFVKTWDFPKQLFINIFDVVGNRASLGVNISAPNGVFRRNGTFVKRPPVVADSDSIEIAVSTVVEPGTGTRTIILDFPPGLSFVNGTFKYPQGWTPEYSQNNGSTWSGTAPVSGVTNIRASGLVSEAGSKITTMSAQKFKAKGKGVTYSGTLANSTGGDVWRWTFWKDRMFGLWPHQSAQVSLECRERVTGLKCANYNPVNLSKWDGYETSNFAELYATDDGKLWTILGRNSDMKIGMLCIDVAGVSPKLCNDTGSPFVSLSDTAYDTGPYLAFKFGPSAFFENVVIGTAPKSAQVVCWNKATQSRCPGTPINVLGGQDADCLNNWAVVPLGENRVLVTTTTTLYCYNIGQDGSLTTCSGVWPVTRIGAFYSGTQYWPTSATIGSYVPVAHYNKDTLEVDGVCSYYWSTTPCLDLEGNNRTDFSNPYEWATRDGRDLYSNVAYFGRFGSTYLSGPNSLRQYFYHPFDSGLYPTPIYCYDWVRNGTCLNWTETGVPLTVLKLYTLDPVPGNSYCMLFSAHDPLPSMGFMDATTGAGNCNSNPDVTIRMREMEVPSTCSTDSAIVGFDTVTVTSVNITNSGTYTGIVLSVLDEKMKSIPGFAEIPVTLGTPANISLLSAQQVRGRPIFVVGFRGVAGGLVKGAEIEVSYVARGPEVCAQVKVDVAAAGSDKCPLLTINSHLSESLTSPVATTKNSDLLPTMLQGAGSGGSCSATITPATVPGPVVALTAVNGTNSIALSFQDPLDNGGYSIWGFEASVNPDKRWTPLTTTGGDNGVPYSATLQGSAASTVWVRGYNIVGAGNSTSVSV